MFLFLVLFLRVMGCDRFVALYFLRVASRHKKPSKCVFVLKSLFILK